MTVTTSRLPLHCNTAVVLSAKTLLLKTAAFAPSSPDQSGDIRILRTDPDKATASAASNIPL
jgi:hypothetical protein